MKPLPAIALAGLGIAIIAGLGACDDGSAPGGEPGSSTKGDPPGLLRRYQFQGKVRLFNGTLSQPGELSGSLEMAAPKPLQVETQIHNLAYTLALAADGANAPYTLVSAPPDDGSYAKWTDQVQFFMEHASPLGEGALASVFRAGSRETAKIRLYPVCSLDWGKCILGALSGFDLGGRLSGPSPQMALKPEGPFVVRPQQ